VIAILPPDRSVGREDFFVIFSHDLRTYVSQFGISTVLPGKCGSL
jgi:hypothetical protein